MAINFPDSPAVDDTFNAAGSVFQWNGTVWKIVSAGSNIVTSETAPSSPSDGLLWFNETDGSLNVYYGDGTSDQWISVGGSASISIATGGGSDQIFWENEQTVTTNYTITNNKNAMSAGPVTIASGVTVTVGDGETWRIV